MSCIMKKVLVINNHIEEPVRTTLQSKMGDGFTLTYVEDIASYDTEGNPTVMKEIEDSEFLVYVILDGTGLPFVKWVLDEGIRLGKRIVAVYVSTLVVKIPAEIESYSDAIVSIESPAFGTAIAGGSVFEEPDMSPKPSRTIKRAEC